MNRGLKVIIGMMLAALPVLAIPAFAEEPAAQPPATQTPAEKSLAKKSAEKGASEEGGAISLDEITVTGTRELERKSETPLAIGVVKGEELRGSHPTHPSEIMGRVPGVQVVVTGGEGHMTSIRQPITTSPVYLYLEDGIPVRSTGFFNHNALYEVNVPQSNGVEVSKGPGTALYGSDAIGGIVNVLTRPAPVDPELDVNFEVGSFGWYRALVSGGATKENNGARVDANVTHSDGWRIKTAYDRQSSTVRWDRMMESGATLKTVATYSNIDQQTAGTSSIKRSDYENNPTANYTPISYRKVNAFRASTDYENESASTLVSVTPYIRMNKMELLPNWSLSYDPQVYTTQNNSLGLMAKYRMDIEPMRTRVIVGADLDYSPGNYTENAIIATKSGETYTAYTLGARTYDYNVAFKGVSPYVHTEFSPTSALRINAGMRYDNMGYSYSNNMSTLTTGSKRRPGSTDVNFSEVSPKVGLTYAFSETLNSYASYRHAFRSPSEGQLFRQGSAINTVGLKPIKVDSYDLGLRGEATKRFTYEVSAYNMTKTDDVVAYTNPDNTKEAQNAGQTLHRGVEVGAGATVTDEVRMDISYSYAKHTYEKWSPKAGVDYSGKEIMQAPSEIGNVRLSYSPQILGGGQMELDWERLGSYWTDDTNLHKYDGHSLFHFKVSCKHKSGLELYGRVANLADARYAYLANYNTGASREEYAPGNPRAFYAGVSYDFK